MTLEQLRERIIFQANADIDDLEDYEPALTGYINRGYDVILEALLEDTHVGETPYNELEENDEEPLVPAWTHIAVADYATWLVYRNGNPQKQSRGQMYLQQAQEVIMKCKNLRGKVIVDEKTGAITTDKNGVKKISFYNVYPPYVDENTVQTSDGVFD